jgi:putative restriction endonuclease
MRFLLSIRTVFPVSGRKVWYDDQRQVHQQIARGDDLIDYAFMGRDPAAADNRWLREAMDAQVPVIYFLGVAPRRYSAIWPVYIADWSASELKARLAFAPPAIAEVGAVPSAPERRCGLRLVRHRRST